LLITSTVIVSPFSSGTRDTFVTAPLPARELYTVK